MIISKEEFLRACEYKLSEDKKKNKLESDIRDMYMQEQKDIQRQLERLYLQLEKQLNINTNNLLLRDDRQKGFYREKNFGMLEDIQRKIKDLEMQLEASRESLNYELDALNQEYNSFTNESINEQLKI